MPSFGKGRASQKFGGFVPPQKTPLWSAARIRFPIPFLFYMSCWVQCRWPLADRPSIGKVMGPQNLVDLFPLKKLHFGVPHEVSSPYPFSVLEILIVVENGLILDLSKIQKFISDTTQVRIFCYRIWPVPRVLVVNPYESFSQSFRGAAPGGKIWFFQYFENGKRFLENFKSGH